MITQLLTLSGSYSPKQLEESVPYEVERMSRTWSALDMVAIGVFSREKALQVYGVTQEDLQAHERQWGEVHQTAWFEPIYKGH